MVVDHTKYFKKKEERYFALGMKATMLLRYFMKFSTYSKLLQVDSMPLDRRNIPLRFALTTFSPKRKTDQKTRALNSSCLAGSASGLSIPCIYHHILLLYMVCGFGQVSIIKWNGITRGKISSIVLIQSQLCFHIFVKFTTHNAMG